MGGLERERDRGSVVVVAERRDQTEELAVRSRHAMEQMVFAVPSKGASLASKRAWGSGGEFTRRGIPSVCHHQQAPAVGKTCCTYWAADSRIPPDAVICLGQGSTVLALSGSIWYPTVPDTPGTQHPDINPALPVEGQLTHAACLAVQ